MTILSHLPGILSALSFPLAVLEADGRIASCNAAWTETLQRLHLSGGRAGDDFAALFRNADGQEAGEISPERIRTFLAGNENTFSCSLPVSGSNAALFRLTAAPENFPRLFCAEIHIPCSDPLLLAGEERLRCLLDAMPDIVCFKDGAGRWLEANQSDLELFRLQGVDYLGKTDGELAAFSPFYREAFLACQESDEKAWQAGTLVRSKEIIPLPDGAFTTLDLYKIPLFHPDGSRKGLVVLGRDITASTLAQENLQQIRRQQEIIEQLLRISFSKTSLASQLSTALELIVEIPWLPLTAKGGIFLVETTKPKTLTLFAQKNMAPSLLQHCGSINFGECLCGTAAEEQRFIFAPHLPAEEAFRYAGLEDQSHYIVPILRDNQLLGVLMLYAEAGYASGETEQKFLESVANALALLIERQQGANRLLISEANLAKAQQIAQLGYWDWHISGNLLSWSDEVYRIFGLLPTKTPAAYDNFLAHIHPDDRPKVQAAVQDALIGKTPYSINHRIIREDGALREVHEEGEVEYDTSGAPLRMFGIVQDITLLKRSEEQMDLAAKVFDSSIEGITITDATGTIQSVNRAFTHITGYNPEEAIGKNPSILKSDRHDAQFYSAMWSTLLAEGKWEGEIWNRRKNGEVYPEWLTITAITDEYGQITHNVAVFHDMSEIRSYEEQLHFHAYHDALTGLPNRLLILDRFTVAISHALRLHKQVAVLVLDLDNFKHINDSLGHKIGDTLLQQVAERLKVGLGDDHAVGRLGGDDFAILIEQCEDEQAAVRMAEKTIGLFAEPFNLAVYETFVTVTIGISFFPNDGSDADTLLKSAELAMYRAKEEGKNKYQLFTPAMNAKVVHRLSLENSLRKALERDEFLVYYQPKVATGTGRIVGMEALVRWQSSDGRLISPLDFIPLAEETGLIIPLGEQVLRKACRDTKQWLAKNKDLVVSVNLSPRQFMQENLLQTIMDILQESGLPPAQLELEVTEGAVMFNEQAALATLHELKEAGIRLALDDFGTGYSSLHFLRKLPLNTLKIDRAFIMELPTDPNSAAIATIIISLAQALHLEVVAEGVENIAQLEFLRRLDCTEIQGYLFSPPVPGPAFAELLNANQLLPLPK
ncbi:EAL domain-containing protein [Thiovibrio frasassiensis]|uniref:EAL domain-containing protein n=1 Tax=Thiovibrio frasassiensis TaxID=2984131 RepID=A0A9X4MGX8_9BACT|nr:EAL domain-containing protein [Thiovibrio frasassiensis]MDG4475318.1 EAL domain-containing protein [Thiovibrio frasassiensis]